jgi:hypothetical protein
MKLVREPVYQNNQTKHKSSRFLEIQAALVIRGLFICEFAYSHRQKRVQNNNFPVKIGL